MDLVAACSAFVHVSEHGSVAHGAAAARVPRAVARRRIAALERHLGARLFHRSARRAVLTSFGRDMLPSARRMVWLAEVMEDYSESARRAPYRVAVPDTCPRLELARLIAEARLHGVTLDPRPADPEARARLLRSRAVRAALVAVPAQEATWRVPLGLAGVATPGDGTASIASPPAGRARGGQRARRVWIQPEDDVPHLRDHVPRIRAVVGPQPARVTVAHGLTAATARALPRGDLLLVSAAHATELGLRWFPIGESRLTRGLDVATVASADPELLRTVLWASVARCVGAPADDAVV